MSVQITLTPIDFVSVSMEEARAVNALCHVINDWAQKKGWNDELDSLDRKGMQIALMHSELSECLEALRAKEQPYMDDKCPTLTGEEAELADCMIRIFHYCGQRGINLGQAIAIKHEFNISRPYRHGKTV